MGGGNVTYPKSPRIKKHRWDLDPSQAECKTPALNPRGTWPGLVGRPYTSVHVAGRAGVKLPGQGAIASLPKGLAEGWGGRVE